ncbi:MAG: hypothetical protein QM765_06290 [Myxococcales bacterium]
MAAMSISPAEYAEVALTAQVEGGNDEKVTDVATCRRLKSRLDLRSPPARAQW